MTSERLRKKKVQVKGEESPILDEWKEVKSSETNIRRLSELLLPGVVYMLI